MTGGIFGGGVIFVIAAVLWAAVLVPSWVRRREFRAAERNALRLQRTLRVLAESAEVPTEVRVEATAREALAQERLLRTAQRRQEAERKAQLAEERTARVKAEIHAQHMQRTQHALKRAARLRRPFVRRIRSTAALVAVLAFGGVFVGAGVALVGQGAAVLVASLAVVAAAAGALVLLAPGRVKVAEIPAEREVVQRAQVAVEPEVVDEAHGELAAVAAHAAAQAAARARIEHAKAMARARAEVPATAMRNQPNSILLEQALAQARVDRHRAEPATVGGATGAPGAGGSVVSASVAGAGAGAGVGVGGSSAASQAQGVSAAASAASAADSAAASSATGSRAASGSRETAASAAARSQQLATAERLRHMGVVGDTSNGSLDLDAALRARRSG